MGERGREREVRPSFARVCGEVVNRRCLASQLKPALCRSFAAIFSIVTHSTLALILPSSLDTSASRDVDRD